MIRNLLGLILIFFSIQGFSQALDSSPYSGLGIGDAVPQRTVEEMSMGGVGVSSVNYNNLYFNNPASYASLVLTAYTIAMQNSASSFKDDNGNGISSNAYLSYIAMGIPIGPKGGLAFGLQPNTTTGYTIEDLVYDGNGDVSEFSVFEGTGGTNRVFLGAGYEVLKGLSLGVESEYIFGAVENSVLHQVAGVQFGTKYVNSSTVDGFNFEAGLIYNKKLKKNRYLNLGVNVGMGSSLKSEGTEFLYALDITGLGVPRDILFKSASTGDYKTPLKTGLGISVGKKNKWSAGVDYSFREAIEITGNLATYNPKLRYDSASNLAVGGFYLPRYNSISSYWHRVIYRWGFNLNKSGMLVAGSGNGTDFTPINAYGISFGVGLPVGVQFSKLNLGFELGTKGTTDNGLIKENFFNFRLGLTLANKWFKKRAIN